MVSVRMQMKNSGIAYGHRRNQIMISESEFAIARVKKLKRPLNRRDQLRSVLVLDKHPDA